MNPLQLTFVLALLAMVISAPLGLEGRNDAPSSAEDEGTPPHTFRTEKWDTFGFHRHGSSSSTYHSHWCLNSMVQTV
ncbi:hypothetical protein B0H10DRAFT_1986462, partial [Mycena sp. CBHHK59/15]